VKDLAENRKGPKWHVPKHKSKLAEATDKTAAIPGPGYYNAEKVDIFPIYKYKPSSVFVSRVEREA